MPSSNTITMHTFIAIGLTVVFLFIRVDSKAQQEETQQLILNFAKLEQLQAILDNMYTGYTILSNGYNKIRMISEGNYSVHQLFLDGLMAVNPTVRNYRRIPQIISYQKLLLS